MFSNLVLSIPTTELSLCKNDPSQFEIALPVIFKVPSLTYIKLPNALVPKSGASLSTKVTLSNNTFAPSINANLPSALETVKPNLATFVIITFLIVTVAPFVTLNTLP